MQTDIPTSASSISINSDVSFSLLNSPTKRKKFFSYPKAKLKNPCQNKCFAREYKYYKDIEYDADLDVNDFWRKMKSVIPGMYRLAIKFLSIPATSGPVERLFSSSGYIIRPHRSRLTPNILEILTMIKLIINKLLNHANAKTKFKIKSTMGGVRYLSETI
ncbi:zinc finger BED domain-containing DAYSLEEPER-like [Brachionus plicatilis]|uniref:Zinc finger BED domain-containing DAYSLEEPER-like n=1 Tax=Brachionus plicatilis TaxID=10195 RepID=A0A3M7S5T4_BRAPC|nr:zinc finger BED domain-containing DAYSLEEPER-like [Brachionus plicatilis]